jgi:zinc transport system substrate-binding protein
MILMKIAPGTDLRRLSALVLTAPLVLAGCGALEEGGGPGGPRVVASFYPLQYVAQRVAGDHAQVRALTSPGVEPHDLELTVRQTAEVADADLVVYLKGLQPAVDAVVEEQGPEHVVEATQVVELEPLDTEAHAGESDEEHADADGDLHLWLDPERMAEVATEVQARLAEIDPDNAAAFEANTRSLQKDLAALDMEYEEGLADCRLDTVVVSHDAFGYLEKYGLRFEPIAGLSPDTEPSPAHLAELTELIRKEGVTTVFSETLASPAMAETLAKEVGLETSVLDPVEGLADETADEDYLSLMRANLEALQAANGCR